jgi:citronellol/citronellal dehydrogenase
VTSDALTLKNKTIIITGASRGIGREFALKFARDGANIVIAAKTAEPHPKLDGTIHTVAEEVKAAGGKALPLQVDVRSEDAVKLMVQETVKTFGSIDALINNAGAIRLTNTQTTPLKSADLMFAVNMRAVFLCSQMVLPELAKSKNPHILNLSPPVTFDKKWYKHHASYTISKMGMTQYTIGMAEEFKEMGIAINSLWPKTIIATAAIKMLMGEDGMKRCRTPEIMADAAYEILTTPSRELSGQTLLDEDFLKTRGKSDFTAYACTPNTPLQTDLFV